MASLPSANALGCMLSPASRVLTKHHNVRTLPFYRREERLMIEDAYSMDTLRYR